jgi:hypothetical protein
MEHRVVMTLPLHDGNAVMVEFIHGTVLRALCVLHRESYVHNVLCTIFCENE